MGSQIKKETNAMAMNGSVHSDTNDIKVDENTELNEPNGATMNGTKSKEDTKNKKAKPEINGDEMSTPTKKKKKSKKQKRNTEEAAIEISPKKKKKKKRKRDKHKIES